LPPIAGKIGRLDGQSSDVAAGMRQTYDEAAVHWVDCHRKDDGDPAVACFTMGTALAITLTAEEIGYLEQLAEAGVRGINAPTPHCGLQRLVDAGYVTDHPVSLHGVLYLITDLGRNALADAER
jgi:hypothetical protein